MKLRGTKTENEFREELIRSNQGIQNPESRLGSALRTEGFNASTAYVLNWIPEPDEDIYLVLIDGSILIRVEIEKDEIHNSPKIQILEISEYLHGLSKINQIQLALAMELANA